MSIFFSFIRSILLFLNLFCTYEILSFLHQYCVAINTFKSLFFVLLFHPTLRLPDDLVLNLSFLIWIFFGTQRKFACNSFLVFFISLTNSFFRFSLASKRQVAVDEYAFVFSRSPLFVLFY